MRNNNPEDAILKSLATDTNSEFLSRVKENNQIIKHNFKKEHIRTLNCALEKCSKPFDITLVPNQVLYPKYCEEHRTEHRRLQFLNLNS